MKVLLELLQFSLLHPCHRVLLSSTCCLLLPARPHHDLIEDDDDLFEDADDLADDDEDFIEDDEDFIEDDDDDDLVEGDEDFNGYFFLIISIINDDCN